MTSHHRAKRRFSQHFITDKHLLSDIVATADIKPGDAILEIGPGRGALTDLLLATGNLVVAVEIDRSLAGFLSRRYQRRDNFCLINQNILTINLLQLTASYTAKNWKIVANLPYHISTPLFLKLLQNRRLFNLMVLMLQKEYALRLVSPVGSKDKKHLSLLSVTSQLAFIAQLAFIVPKDYFSPRPKVDSALVTLKPISNPLLEREADFLDLVRKLYCQRRKIIKNSLQHYYYNNHNLPKLLVNASLIAKRPEELSWQEWFYLFEVLFDRQKLTAD